MRRPRVRRLQALVLGLLLAGLGVLALVFDVGQLQGVALSVAVQHDGALATASTVRVVENGSHGGVELEVRFMTARGQQVRTRLWDGASDAVGVRRTLAVRYLADHPTEAEPDGQPFNTAGQEWRSCSCSRRSGSRRSRASAARSGGVPTVVA